MSKARVVVTGADGPIATAIVRRLREAGLEVEPLRRGDDVADAVRSADSVVVLDATVLGASDYRLALDAVAHALDATRVKRLISVALFPSKDPDSFRARAEKLEEPLRQAGLPLTVIRVAVIVGSPAQPGPLDDVLFTTGKRITFRGSGDQRFRPLMLDDLAAIVVGVLELDAAPELLELEGPEETSLRQLLEALNPGRDIQPARALWPIAFGLAALFPLLFLQYSWTTTSYERWHWVLLVPFALGFGPAVYGYIQWLARAGPASLIPSADLLLTEDSRECVAGIRLTRVEEAWNTATLSEREQRRRRQRSAHKYAATQGSLWIAGFLLLSGAAAFIAGAHDMLNSESSLGTRLAGSLLALAGGTAVLGGIALLTRWTSRYPIAFLGSAVCVALLLTLTASSLLSGDGPAWVWFAAIYAVPAALGCCAALWKRGGLQVKNVMASRGQRVLGSVILGGTLLTLGQVLYSSVYVPATVIPSLSGTAELKASKEAISATVTLRNPSNHSVRVLGAFYVVKAHLLSTSEMDAPAQQDATRGGREHIHARALGSHVVDRGTLLPRGTTLEGGQEFTRTLVVATPDDGTLASLRADLALARPRYRGERAATIGSPTPGVQHSVAEIDDPSWIHKLTRSARYVHVLHALRNQLGCKPQVQIAAYVDGQRATKRERWCAPATKIDDFYGITFQQFFHEVPLP